MSFGKELGDAGEELAKSYLIGQDFTILEQNWRFSRAEIDIIAREREVLVFVEVKSRSYDYYGQPEESIGQKKQGLIIDAAFQYMNSIGHEWEVRFDIISIVKPKGKKAVIKHFRDAFF